MLLVEDNSDVRDVAHARLRGLGYVVIDAADGAKAMARIEAGREHLLTTPHGTLRAPTLVLATNGYTPSLGYFSRGVLPLHSHCIATEPLPLARWRELGEDGHDRHEHPTAGAGAQESAWAWASGLAPASIRTK